METRFEILEHTADIGIRALGNTLPELFATAALAVESIAVDTEAVEPRLEYPLAASGEDRESLLVNWLNEIVYYLDGPHIVFAAFRIAECTDTTITAVGVGEPRDFRRHPPRIVVKAATYHQLKVCEQGGCWIAEVFLDI